jgi:hypothetical protein
VIVDNSNWYLPCNSHSPNSRRPHEGPASAIWQLFLSEVKDWHCLWTTNGVTDTTLWVKPEHD